MRSEIGELTTSLSPIMLIIQIRKIRVAVAGLAIICRLTFHSGTCSSSTAQANVDRIVAIWQAIFPLASLCIAVDNGLRAPVKEATSYHRGQERRTAENREAQTGTRPTLDHKSIKVAIKQSRHVPISVRDARNTNAGS